MPVTANSFTLAGNPTPAQIAALDSALHYLQTNSPSMATPLLETAAENQVRIVFADPVVNRFDGYSESQHTIVWDPAAGLVVFDKQGNPLGIQSPANGLIHEIAHSLEVDQAARHNDATHPNGQYDNDSEATATLYANAVAKDCGEPERIDYASARDIPVSNSTAHTEQSPNGSGQVWVQENAVGHNEIGPAYSPDATAPTFGSTASNGGTWEGSGGFDPSATVDLGSPGGSRGSGIESGNDFFDGGYIDACYGDWGGSNGGCVSVASVMPDGRTAGDIRVADTMALGDQETMESSAGIVTYSQLKQAPGFRITTETGVSLVCSDTAPIPAKDRGLLTPQHLLGERVAVRWDENGESKAGWETVVKVEAIGVIHVQHITVGDRCFWAGEKSGAYILHHNVKNAGDGGWSDYSWDWLA